MPDTRYTYEIEVDNPNDYDAEYEPALTLAFQVFVPDGYEGRPTDVADLLKRARALLAEEGRWISGGWFKNSHPDLDPEDAFCNNWGVCMDGALIAVDVGMRGITNYYGTNWYCPNEHITESTSIITADDIRAGGDFVIDAPLLQEARRFLVEAGSVIWPEKVESCRRDYAVGKARYFEGEVIGPYDEGTYPEFQMYVPTFNDGVCQSRTQAIEWLDKAIELAEQSDSNG